MPGESQSWLDLRSEFDALGEKRRSMPASEVEMWFAIECLDADPSGLVDGYKVQAGYDHRLKVEFEKIATRAGFLLGCREGKDPLHFWFYSLARELANGPGNPAFRVGWNVFIEDLIQASAFYCSRLAAKPEHSEGEGTVDRQTEKSVDRTPSPGPDSQNLPTAGTSPPTVVLGTSGQPAGRLTESVFAADPKIQKLVKKDPNVLPAVELVSRIQHARSEAEEAFRQRELTEDWHNWRGRYPWDDDRDPDSTDCPWWIAGAEYVFHLAAVWRKYSPGEPDKIEAILPTQITALADFFYRSRLLALDIFHGKGLPPDELLGERNTKRFSNIAFLFAFRKFAESDLEERRAHTAKLADALNNLAVAKRSAAPLPPAAVSSGAEAARKARAETVAKLIKELDSLKPQMLGGETEYIGLREQYPQFLTFRIAENRPDLRLKVLSVQGSTRHIRLAQELTAAHHGRELSTIKDDWKFHKPTEFKRQR